MEGGLTVFAGLNVNISCLEVPGCWSCTTKKYAGCANADAGPCNFTDKFHCLIPEDQKVSLLQVFNLGVDIVGERLSWTWSGVLTCTQKNWNHRPHLLTLI